MSNATITRRDYKTTTRLWGKCVCGCTWQWNGKTEHADNGVYTIEHSACFCPGQKWDPTPVPEAAEPAAAEVRTA